MWEGVLTKLVHHHKFIIKVLSWVIMFAWKAKGHYGGGLMVDSWFAKSIQVWDRDVCMAIGKGLCNYVCE